MNMPRLRPLTVTLAGGLDLVSPSYEVRPGRLRASYNVEAAVDGGYQRVGGFERFDGKARPSDATYVMLTPETAFDLAEVGATLTASPSGATGVVIFSSPQAVVLTRVVGTFALGDALTAGPIFLGVYADQPYPVTASQDNAWMAAAAEVYRPDIAAVPGSGPVRGLEILEGNVYAWRDNAAGTALVIHKATSTGWQPVPLFTEVGFDQGAEPPAEGSTITKGGVSAKVMRVCQEGGQWTATTARGRLIVTNITGGTFTAGAVTTGGTLNLAALTGGAVQADITLQPGGRVQCDTYNFTAANDSFRLYGCDGVNREFEFDGETLAPINTGMVDVRAKHVRCHRNNLIYAYRGSMQVSGLGNPFAWSVNLGAAELGTGDTITGLRSIAGSESAAALMVHCQSSVWMLYGDSGAFKFVRLSERRGANPYSVQDIGQIIAHDTPGFVLYRATQAFGNLDWDIASRAVTPIVKEKTPLCSVFVKSLSRYRVFFADGSSITGTPRSDGSSMTSAVRSPSDSEGGVPVAWCPVYLPIKVCVAASFEVNGVTRTFYGTDTGMVYEADVGRSFDGEPIAAAMKLAPLSAGSPMVDKTWFHGYVECQSEGPFLLSYAAEFNEGAQDSDQSAIESRQMSGTAALYDISRYDAAYYDANDLAPVRIDIRGEGHSVAPVLSLSSAIELSPIVKAVTLQYVQRKMRK